MRVWLLLGVLLLPPASVAGPAATVEREAYTVEVHEAGTRVTITDTRTFVVYDPELARDLRWVVGYEDARRYVAAIEATIHRANGDVIRLDEDDVEVSSLNPGYALFRDTRQHLIELDLRAGDRVETRIVSEVVKVLFFPRWWFGDEFPVAESAITVTTPPGYRFFHLERDGAPAPDVSADSTRWTWRTTDLPAFPDDGDIPRVALAPGRLLDGHAVTGWPDVAAFFGPAYAAARQGPEVTREARRLVPHPVSPVDALSRLVPHLTDRLRYVAVTLELGGWFPPPAATTLEVAYGDCKAMANLLVGLLEAVEAPAVPVLIGTVGLEDADPAFPDPGAFNHVIAMIPGDRDTTWIDLTDVNTRPGELPWWDQGRHVLPLSDPCPGLVRTPVDPPDRNRREITLLGRVDARGRVSGTLEVRLTGQESRGFRHGVRHGSLSAEDVGRRLWRGSPHPGMVATTVDGPTDDGALTVRFEVSGVPVLRRVRSRVGLDLSLLDGLLPEIPDSVSAVRPLRIPYASTTVEEVRLDVSEMGVTATPVELGFGSGVVDAHLAGHVDGDTLVVTRRATLSSPFIPVGAHAATRSGLVRLVSWRGGVPSLSTGGS